MENSAPGTQLPDFNDLDHEAVTPPSYDSLYGKVKAAKQTSNSTVEFFKKFIILVLGTLGCTICMGLVLAIPISMIAIGAVYIDDCRAERYIPIYLIVAGCFGILKNISSMVQRIKNSGDEEADEKNAKPNPFDGIISCFLFAWFIAGNVWIYRTYGQFDDTDTTAWNYCHPTLYWFAFWMTTVTYIIMGSVCVCVCLGGIIAACIAGCT